MKKEHKKEEARESKMPPWMKKNMEKKEGKHPKGKKAVNSRCAAR